MSSFTDAAFQDTGKRVGGFVLFGRRWFGHPVYSVHGRDGNGFRFYFGYPGSGWWIDVPEAFETDLDSTPWWGRWVIRLVWPKARWAKSAAVHDRARRDDRLTLLTGNNLFAEAMEVEGTPAALRKVARVAVSMNDSRT